MMDAVVQFLRNALCCLKNFNILGDTFLYDPKVTARYYSFPSPLDQTTPLEVLIATTQFYAFASISIAGCRMIARSGIVKLRLISRLMEKLATSEMSRMKEKVDDKKEAEKKKGDKKDTDEAEGAALRLVTLSLIDESDAAIRSFFVGLNVLVVGLAFFWLFANSFHVTSTDWIGGTAGLIHALTVMEIGLVVFLYYMVKDAGSLVRKSWTMKDFADKLSAIKKLSSVENVSVEQYSWLVGGWSPFWAGGSSGFVAAEEKMVAKEEEAVASKLVAFSKKVDQDTIDRIRAQSRISLFEGYREYVYLILNFFAFYGYLVCIIVYYYQEEGSQPDYIRSMLLWMPNGDADWLGNAVGDFMWTAEPIVILTSPMLIKSMTPKEKKEKSD
ncbi:hypothetical protein ACHAWF_010996 [Thalassiosira exigua]